MPSLNPAFTSAVVFAVAQLLFRCRVCGPPKFTSDNKLSFITFMR